MAELDLIATTTFGLEAVAKRELLSLGYEELFEKTVGLDAHSRRKIKIFMSRGYPG